MSDSVSESAPHRKARCRPHDSLNREKAQSVDDSGPHCESRASCSVIRSSHSAENCEKTE